MTETMTKWVAPTRQGKPVFVIYPEQGLAAALDWEEEAMEEDE